MPQPFNWKDSDNRLADTIQFIRNAGETLRYRDVADHLHAWNINPLNGGVKQTLSLAMHQGFHWEAGRSGEAKIQRKAKRDRQRAMLLMRVVILGETSQQAQLWVDRVPEPQHTTQFSQLVGTCADHLMGPPNLNVPSGRMRRSGLHTANNRTAPFFADQDRLFAHFKDNVLGGIQHDLTKEVYRKALLTAGNTSWAAGNSDPASKGRFANFDANPDGQLLIVNCWEALLFWACKANAFSVAACRKLYDEYNPNARSENIGNLFGTETVFDQGTARPGDVLTWVNNGNLNHVAMYAGLGPDAPPSQALVPYVIHNLALDQQRDGVGQGFGTTHFRTIARMAQDYLILYGPATCYHNRPFWNATGNTPQYQYRQHLMA